MYRNLRSNRGAFLAASTPKSEGVAHHTSNLGEKGFSKNVQSAQKYTCIRMFI